MPINAPKIGVFGQCDPLNGVQYQRKPKSHTLVWVRVIWAIKCKNVLNSVTCRELLKKMGINKKNFRDISPVCPEAPHVWISTKFCTAVEVVDVITCDKFFAIG